MIHIVQELRNAPKLEGRNLDCVHDICVQNAYLSNSPLGYNKHVNKPILGTNRHVREKQISFPDSIAPREPPLFSITNLDLFRKSIPFTLTRFT
jgi:hypothetical protein